MPASIRTLTAALTVSAVAALSATTACAATGANNASSGTVQQGAPGGQNNLGTEQAAAPAVNPGLAGQAIVLANNAEFSGYDAATDASGTAYIGWIGNTGPGRKVSLCTLPRGATSCQGSVQQIDSLGDSTASGLRVLVTGPHTVTLVWQHITTASESGPQGDEIAVATSTGGALTAAHDVATAPSFGAMMDAVLGPNGTIWVVSEPEGSHGALQIRPGFSNAPVNLKPPFLVGSALLRFDGSTAVLAIDKDGAISDPVSFASENGGSWSAFQAVAGTWTSAANFGLATTTSGVRLIATIDNADYFPVVSPWTSSGFGSPVQTDSSNCTPFSHDAVADASGRLADVSEECSGVAVANLADTEHAGVVRFTLNGTLAGGNAQLTTTPSGRAWVAWSIESTSGDELLVAPLLLPGSVVTVTKSSGSDAVTLTGPASCLPPVDLNLGLKGTPAGSVTSKVLKLNGATLASMTLHGGALAAAKNFTLTGTVRFSGGSTVTATLKFRTCPK